MNELYMEILSAYPGDPTYKHIVRLHKGVVKLSSGDNIRMDFMLSPESWRSWPWNMRCISFIRFVPIDEIPNNLRE
jgi:hypothetical protein